MKWIKYKVVCNENKNVLIDKKIGYSEENLTIALEEAYNGEYEITEDEASEIKTELGFVFRGTDPLTSSDEDTPAFWDSLKSGIWDFTSTAADFIKGLGSMYGKGTLINCITANNFVSQLFISSYGVFFRYGKKTSAVWYENCDNKNPWSRLAKEHEVQTLSGGYVGHGRYGSANANSLTIKKDNLKAVMIYDSQTGRNAFFLTQNITDLTEGQKVSWVDATESEVFKLTMYFDSSYTGKGKKIIWYSDEGSAEQLNISNRTYYWVAW